MTTKTDFHSIMELREKYTPVQRGIVSFTEIETIREILELGQRNGIELQNIRDTAVMLYSQWSDVQREKNDTSAMSELMDAMSAVCFVIDEEKNKRGLPV